jgi:hypothetical protein
LNENDDWTHASTHFGITTHYRREADNSFSIKLEGEMEGVPLFEQLCTLKEVDLHSNWSPGCTSSLTIAELDKLDTVGWVMIGVPSFGLARDMCFRVIGCDNILENGCIILAGQGLFDRKPNQPPPEDSYLLEDPILSKLDIPAGEKIEINFVMLPFLIEVALAFYLIDSSDFWYLEIDCSQSHLNAVVIESLSVKWRLRFTFYHLQKYGRKLLSIWIRISL